MPDPSARREMETGPPASLANRWRRFSSPKAAKSAAGALEIRSGKVLPQILQLSHPPILILPEGFPATCRRNAIEASFGHCEPGALRDIFELEDNGGHRLRGIDVGIAARMPLP